MPATLPTVLFSNVGPVAADAAAHVRPSSTRSGEFDVLVRHPHGGHIYITSMRVREDAEAVAAEVNNLIGAWARVR